MKREIIGWVIIISLLLASITFMIYFSFNPMRVDEVEVTEFHYTYLDVENEQVIEYWTSDVESLTIEKGIMWKYVFTMKDGNVLTFRKYGLSLDGIKGLTLRYE